MNIKRFTPVQKAFHLLLLLSFLIQAATGVGRMYYETGFGRFLAAPFGGYDACLTAHKAVGLFMIGLFLAHLVYVLVAALPRAGFGPDSLWPKTRDAKDFLKHVRWMLGLAREPEFERWGYWEKFDYWAVFWGMVVIGGTGIMLYDPLWTSRAMDGRAINVAFWIHRIEAILAMLHVFIIHFLIAHLRRSRFPMDQAMFAGGVPEDEIREERPEWWARLGRRGDVGRLSEPSPGATILGASYAFGLLAVALGFFIVVGGVMYAGYVTW
jgi:formate dehydrogenase subunit gamma